VVGNSLDIKDEEVRDNIEPSVIKLN